jgi:ABC-type transporter Mla subunit MlaD
MTKQRNSFKAGLFILVSIALIVTVILSIKGIGRIFAPQQERSVSFKLTDDIGGLQVGDEVRLGGFKVGVVKDIEVRSDAAGATTTTKPSADSTQLIVKFSLPGKYELHENAVVGVQATITGNACLNISSLGSGNAIDNGVAIVGKPAALNSLLASLGDVSGDIKPIVSDVRVAAADVRGQVGPALVEYRGAGKNLREMLGDTKGDFRGTMSNLNTATATIKDKLPDTMDAAKQFIARLDDTVKNTSGTLEDVKTSMANFKVVSVKAREVVGGNKGKLDSMIASLKVTGDNLKAASGEIRHSPWRLLYKPGKGELANLNLYDSARQFADGAGSLNDAALSLRDALGNKDVKPDEVKELLHKLDTSFANFKQVEDKLWTQVQE